MSLDSVRARIEAAANRSGRSVDQITLIAVGKTQSVDVLMEAYEAGHRDFGENRAAELAAKSVQMPSDIRWHFIGHLQRNKVRLVRPAAGFLHSMDRLSLGAAWLKGPGIAPPALLEVNLAAEPQKAGAVLDEAVEIADQLVELGVDLRGVMAIPPQAEDPERTRPYFRGLRRLRDELIRLHPGVKELSMGMTEDFEVAIEEGATMIRVGRAIFGPRIQQ